MQEGGLHVDAEHDTKPDQGSTAFSMTVTGLLDAPAKVDLDKIEIEIPDIELPPPLDFGQPRN